MKDSIENLKKYMENDTEMKKEYDAQMQSYDISSVLKQIRKNKGLTQQQVADMSGLTRQMVSKVECYSDSPTLITLIKYCNAIGLDLYEILLKETKGE
jgi:transcriptional regulator with XRE-family HTH domain